MFDWDDHMSYKKLLLNTLLGSSALVLFACSSGGGNDISRQERANIQCDQIAAREFDPVFMLNNPPSTTRDLDNDGVPDVKERELGTNMCRLDSDGDGLTDYQEAVIAGVIKPDNPIDVDVNCDNYGEDCDVDEDGVTDFKETHGYYYDNDDSKFYSLPRLIKLVEWEQLKVAAADGSGSDLNPWLVAINALENAGFKQIVDIEENGQVMQYVRLNVEAARRVIIEAFLNIYQNKNHLYLTGGSNEQGSVANIMNTLLAKRTYNKTLSGQEVDVYYTDATQYSTDFDPYSDAEEVSRVNALPDVIHPADHPLIAGYPRIRPTIHKIIILPKEKITDSKGNSVTDEWSTTTTTMDKKTTGWSIGGKVGGSQDKGAEAGIGGGYSNQTTNMNSTAEKVGGKSAVDFKNAVSYDPTCAAHAWFEISFENVGTAAIYEMQPAFNIHVKDNTYTFSPNALNRVPLKVDSVAPGFTSKRYTLPYVGESGAARSAVVCLTIDDLAYIENENGQIMIEMIPNQGEILYWDKQANVLGTKGKWTNYKSLIDASGAKIDFTLVDQNNKIHQGNYIAYAGAAPRLTLGEALKKILTDEQQSDSRLDVVLPSCPSDAPASKVCIDANGVIQLGDQLNTFVAIHAFDATNKLIPYTEISDEFKQKLSSNNSADIMSLPLNPRWRYEIISYEGINKPYASGTRVDADATGFTVSGWASDDYGSEVQAEFCKTGYTGDQDSGDCSPMERVNLTNAGMLRFSIVLPNNYAFKGEEHMRLINTDGATKVALESVDVTEVGFKLSGPTNALVSYYQNILNRLQEYTDNVHSSILNRLGGEKRITNNLGDYKQDVLEKKAEVEALVEYCSNSNAKNITDIDELEIYTRKCTSQEEITLLGQKQSVIDNGTVLPEWKKLVSKITVSYYQHKIDDFNFLKAKRDMATPWDDESDYEYFNTGVECYVPTNRVITKVSIAVGLKGHTKNSSRVRRSSSHLREIYFESYTINPYTYAFENKKGYKCETDDDAAFWTTQKNDGNYHHQAQSVDKNKREYITGIGLSLQDTKVSLCVRYAKIDNVSGELKYAGQKGSGCSSPEKTSWSWRQTGSKALSALRGLKIANGTGSANNAGIDRHNVKNLASSYNRINVSHAEIYDMPMSLKLLNPALVELKSILDQWTSEQNSRSQEMQVSPITDSSSVVGRNLAEMTLARLVCPELSNKITGIESNVYNELMSGGMHPGLAAQIASGTGSGIVDKIKQAQQKWLDNPTVNNDYLTNNPISIKETTANFSACGFLAKAWEYYHIEVSNEVNR